jgi:hypothetical protein
MEALLTWTVEALRRGKRQAKRPAKRQAKQKVLRVEGGAEESTKEIIFLFLAPGVT